MEKLIYLSKFEDDSLNVISFKLLKSFKKNVNYLLMILFVGAATVIAQVSVDDPNLLFFFNTALFVCLLLIIKISHSLYSLYRSRKSVFQLQLNRKEIEHFLFVESKGIQDKSLIARSADLICIITKNDTDEFYTVIGNDKSIHKSAIKVRSYDKDQYYRVISTNDFAVINENW